MWFPKALVLLVPQALLLIALIQGDPHTGSRAFEPLLAGPGAGPAPSTGIESDFRSFRGTSGLQLETEPQPIGEPTEDRDHITLRKRSRPYPQGFDNQRRKWVYLDREIRQAIDAALEKPERWESIVIHASGSKSGDATMFDHYHKRIKHVPDGLVYHFVIGNGTRTPLGKIELGNRWLRQVDSPHLQNKTYNRGSIAIALVGNFDETSVEVEQLAALDELVDFLRAKTGEIPVVPHRAFRSCPTACPGKLFPHDLLRKM